MVEKAESPYVRVFAFCFLFGRTNIETSQLFFRDVIKFASFSRYQGAVSARGFGHVSADPEASRTQKKASDTQGTSKEEQRRISELLSDRHVSFLQK